MNRPLRYVMWGICIVQGLFAIGFLLQIPAVTRLWPLPDTTPMSFIFIASIFAAAFASTLWCLWAREDGALAGIALDYMAIFAPLAIFSFQLSGSTGRYELTLLGIACAVGVVFGNVLLRATFNIPIRDPRPLPTLVKWSFVVFVIALILVGGALVLMTPNVLPWSVTPELGVVFGWMFLGAAAYFAYTVARPSWGNAVGQLAGFLAYDLVLIIPFLQRLPTIAPELQTSLIIYIAVLVYSGLLAIYYLLVNRGTRIVGARDT